MGFVFRIQHAERGINIGNLMMVPSIEMQAQQATGAATDIKIVVQIERGQQ